MDTQQVVIVDENGLETAGRDGETVTMGKMDAHSRGWLHRATSVFIFNDIDELLIQQRASGKYHSPLKWSNTCCTHPSPEETPLMAANRCLLYEMGMTTELIEMFSFIYRADVGNGLTENEFDHVFLGVSNQCPSPCSTEVADWTWINVHDLRQNLVAEPDLFSPWLHACFGKVMEFKRLAINE